MLCSPLHRRPLSCCCDDGLCAGLYVAWACVPSSVLDALGITYYPSRYWVIAVPVWLSIGMIVYLAGYHAANFLQGECAGSVDMQRDIL